MRTERLDCQIDELLAIVELDLDVLARNSCASFHRFTQGGSQVKPQTAPRHGKELTIGQAGRRLKIFAGARGKVEDIALRVHDNMRWRKPLDYARFNAAAQVADRPAGLLPQLAAGRITPPLRHEKRKAHRGSGVIAPLKDALLLVDGREQVTMLRNVFRRAEKEEPALAQSKVKHR